MPGVYPDAGAISPEDREALDALERALQGQRQRDHITLRVRGQSVRLHKRAVDLVSQALRELTEPRGAFSPQEAADRLNVSRTYLLKLLDDGILPFSRTEGGHRRIHRQDFEEYAARMAEQQSAGLDAMRAIGEEAGLYVRELEEARK